MTTSNSLAALEGVYKRYGEQVALDGLDLEVGEGELLALPGPNGAGKTTAISILLGLKRPDAGSVRLLGGSPRDIANRRGVGVMLQQEQLMMDMTLREMLDVVTSYYPNPMYA
jgi:ABC-2 type transport system ATP-binding protein